MSRRTTRNSENEDGNSFKEETLKWNKVAEMIGGTLEDVYNMDGTERNALLSLLPSEAEIKENNEQFVDLQPLLSEYDHSYATALTSFSSRGQESSTDDSASPRHSPSVVNQKLNKSLEVVTYVDGVSIIQDFDEMEGVNKMTANTLDKDKMEESLTINELNLMQSSGMNDVSLMDQMPTTQKKSSDEKEMYKNSNIDECSMESKEMLTHDESKPWQTYSVVKENYASIIGSISKFQHVDVHKNVISKVPSSTDCFKMIEESPENYKFDINKAYDSNMTKSNIDASLKDILKLFSGVKHIKSQTVASFGEELHLVNVYPDSSVKNGFQCLMPSTTRRGKGMSDETGSSSPGTEAWWQRAIRSLGVDSLGRTRASTSQATHHLSSYNVDDHDDEESACNIDEYNFDGEDYVNDLDLNKKYEKPRRKTNRKEKGKGKKSKGQVKGKRKSSETEDEVGITKEKSTGRGRAASKELDINDDETEPSVAESRAAPSSPGTSIRAHNTGHHQTSYNTGHHQASYNTGHHQTSYNTGHHQTSVDEFEALSSLAAGTSSVESTLTEEFAICPMCRSKFRVSQVERHLIQCNGDVRQVEEIEDDEKDFCYVCAQMVSLSSFEDHQKVCSGECSLHQRILKKMKF